MTHCATETLRYSKENINAEQCLAAQHAARQMQGGRMDSPALRPLARAVVQPTVEYVTDMTAATRDTSAKELKFGNCTGTSHCKNQNRHSAC